MAKRGRKKIIIDPKALASLRDGMSTAELAKHFSVSSPTVLKALKEIDGIIPVPKQVIPKVPAQPIADPKEAAKTEAAKEAEAVAALKLDKTFDMYFKEYKEIIGWKGDILPKQPEMRKSATNMTVVAGDLHVPYQHDGSIKWMIQQTANRADNLIIAGDLADMFNFSRYAKFQRHYTAMEEMVKTQAALAMLASAYKRVTVLRGNHDDRYIKYLCRQGMNPDIMRIFEYLYGEYALHPVYLFAKGLPNVEVVAPIVKDYAEFSYLYQQGDAIISHAEKYSTTPNKCVGDVIQALKSYHEPQGLIQPFKIVIQAHTHQAGKTWNNFGVVGIENGCMCQTPDYAGQAGRLPTRASVLGYTELHQTNGVTDMELTNFLPYQNQ